MLLLLFVFLVLLVAVVAVARCLSLVAPYSLLVMFAVCCLLLVVVGWLFVACIHIVDAVVVAVIVLFPCSFQLCNRASSEDFAPGPRSFAKK